MMIDPVIAQIIAYGLFALLLISGIEKFKNQQAFSQVLRGYRLLPIGLISSASLVLPLIEIVLALSVIWVHVKLAALVISALLTVYAAAILINIHRGNLSLDCGCQLSKTRQTITIALVYRNIALASAALILFLPTTDRTLGVYDYVAVAFGSFACILFYMTLNELIANTTSFREIL
ncbi:hypothetical protein KOI40_15825 [Aestuariicella sp. G3-2]|uniref:MauE/DoxX family redox-associated membrane protein n=1 Tax=Pseudomaricurvus albidus TaxID=2842452 RepID=UPI001C0AEF9E|nr:MauE/DoxX family redox-associated membrane protein [Aestuariicella albida]MBU3071294.1 hypothetical protein [Aestuariicella albida]